MKSILEKIAVHKRLEVEQLKVERPIESLLRHLHRSSGSPEPAPSFAGAISTNAGVNIIAEIKKGSPSKGILLSDFNPILLARKYREGGAVALSVLTDEKHFFGRFEYMEMAAIESGLPIICKDFIIDRYQLYHARAMKADAVLLIAALHSERSLSDLLTTARDIALDCLVEVHNEEELEKSLAAGAAIIGVNNRNLSDFSVSLEVSERLASLIPDGIARVAESGISSPEDIVRLREAGYHNFLIGEALVTAADPAALIRSLRQA